MPTFSIRAYLESATFVAAWMAVGLSARLDANAYLLLGVPLLLLFQVIVRKRSISQLWVRGTTAVRLRPAAMVGAAALAGVPAYELVRSLFAGEHWIAVLWLCCSVGGAVPAAFAIQEQKRSDIRAALEPMLSAIVVGCAFFSLAAFMAGKPALPRPGDIWVFAQHLALYFPVTFILEEVVFRGSIDSHLTDNRSIVGRAPWPSALFVSALWGIWHLPLVLVLQPSATWFVGVQVVAFHTGLGVLLSFAWRAGGTLLAPAVAHSLIDAYRDVLIEAGA